MKFPNALRCVSFSRGQARTAAVIAPLALVLGLATGCPEEGTSGDSGSSREVALVVLDPERVTMAAGATSEIEVTFRTSRRGAPVYEAEDVPEGFETEFDDSRRTAATSSLTDLFLTAGGADPGIYRLQVTETQIAWDLEPRGELTVVVLPGESDSIESAVAIAAGAFHSLAIVEGGALWAWGRNDRGQLGDGTTTDRPAPVRVTGLPRPALAISAGRSHSVALLDDGTVWCWGENTFGKLGRAGLGEMSLVPVRTPITPVTSSAPPVPPITAIAAGGDHTLALDESGAVWSWGRFGRGQLGRLSREIIDNPDDFFVSPEAFPVGLPARIIAIAAGDEFSLALEEDGRLWGWGDNASSQLGDDLQPRYLSPIDLIGFGTVRAIAAGNDHTIALLEDGTVRTAGSNTFGQLGVVERRGPLAARVPNLFNVVAVAAGFVHSLALLEDGTVMSWGENSFNQLGFPEVEAPSSYFSPVLVQGLPPARAITGGGRHSLALPRACGGVWSFGDNIVGQLGDGTSEPNGFPVRVDGIGDGADAPDCGASLSVVLRGRGRVTSDSGALDCPGDDCALSGERGSSVRLTATPDDGWIFAGWEGGASGTDPAIDLTFDGSRNVVAVFLETRIPPTARFTWDPLEPVAGSPVTFDASASEDLDGEIVRYEWSSADDAFLEGIGERFTYTEPFARPHRVTLRVYDDDGLVGETTNVIDFSRREPEPEPEPEPDPEPEPVPDPGDSVTLTLVFRGEGTGSVESRDGAVDCTGDCAVAFPRGARVELLPVPDPNAFFSHWTACDIDSGIEGCTIDLDVDRTIEVFFE